VLACSANADRPPPFRQVRASASAQAWGLSASTAFLSLLIVRALIITGQTGTGKTWFGGGLRGMVMFKKIAGTISTVAFVMPAIALAPAVPTALAACGSALRGF